MIVPSFAFLAFALGAAILYNLQINHIGRKFVLLFANLAFLASFAATPIALAPFVAFLLVGYGAMGLARATQSQRLAGALLIVAMVLIFAWLKKYAFFPQASFLPFAYLTIGLSYVFFRVLHLVIDAAQGSLDDPPGPLDYCNYALNFLSLVSGPIQRYEDYKAQQQSLGRPGFATLLTVCERTALGFFKVIVVSMLLLEQHKLAVADLAADQPLPARVATVLQVVLLYPIYLYANFSGYCDVVIALGKLFRFDLPENFNRPFSSENFINFWGRWHITLSGWLKTYVFSPLMMVALKRTSSSVADTYLSAGAFFVTFFLVGIWHGQTSEFVFFGLLQGGGVAINKLYQTAMIARLGRKGYRALAANRLYTDLSRGLTFVWFGFTLIWFWSDWNTVALIGYATGTAASGIALLIALAGASAILAALVAARARWGATGAGNVYMRTIVTTAQITAVWLIVAVLSAPPPDIVYKTF